MYVVLAGLTLIASPALASGDGPPAKTSSGDSARPNFVEFPQMAASVLQGYRVRGMMVLGFGLEIEDSKLRKKARSLLPRLQDTYTREFNRYAGNAYNAGEVPDAQYLSTRMQTATDRMLGKGKAVFLISNLMVRAQ
ncbi:MAG: hypothetical protein COA47_02700 [Robiginitomaculum sp.]|nr:MAG: hypothetical protein COA47_02700 [Robiginitomaculum sp.]